MPLEVTITDEPNKGKRITLAGSLDTDTAPQLEARINESIDSSVTALILDIKTSNFSVVPVWCYLHDKERAEQSSGEIHVDKPATTGSKGIRKNQGIGWHEHLQRPGRDGCLSGRYAATGTGWRVVAVKRIITVTPRFGRP